jgi:hypothetical protein
MRHKQCFDGWLDLDTGAAQRRQGLAAVCTAWLIGMSEERLP